MTRKKRSPEFQEVLTPKEVAKIFGVATKTLTTWCHQGKIPFFLTLGGHKRFYRTVVEEIREKGLKDEHAPLRDVHDPSEGL